MAVDQPFRFPAAFTFVMRAFTTLEGLGKALDPGFQFVTVAQPYAQEILDIQVQAKHSQAGILVLLCMLASRIDGLCCLRLGRSEEHPNLQQGSIVGLLRLLASFSQ